MVLGIGHPDAVTKYVAWLFDNPTYLYECFDMVTPQSFLYDFVKHGNHDECVTFLPWNRMLVKEFPGGYVEYFPAKKGMRAVVKTWYVQCEQICSLLLRASFVLDDGPRNASDAPLQIPRNRARLDTQTIVATLRALHFQFQTLADLDDVEDFMYRMCLRHPPRKPSVVAAFSSNPLNIPTTHGTRTPNQPTTPPPEGASDSLCPVSPQR